MVVKNFCRLYHSGVSLILVLAAAVALSAGFPLGAEMLEPISYTLRFPAPQTHYVEVEAIFPTEGRPEIELMMAVWTPGSYMVREFSRHVEALTAEAAGARLPVTKTSKNRWRVETHAETGTARTVAVRYRVYSREMTVRTNFVDAGFAILNGAPTFLTLAGSAGAGHERRPHDVRLVLPPQWKVAASPLAPPPGSPLSVPSGGGAEHLYRAEDFDTLVDSPFYAGNAAVYRFEVDGRPHLLVNEGENDIWDGPRSVADVERIVREQAAFWRGLPYPRYVFFNLITESSGGLEHRDSSVLMASRWQSRTADGYREWLSLVSHELFHAWNVKRLRPVELGPFDYEREAYTRSLWFSEGVTSYYDMLLVHRAGLATREQLFKDLSRKIETLQTSPGRLVQPLEDASFDAWIKYYRRDENFLNTGVSYYTKGAVAAFLLDVHIRRLTGNRRSLDDVLRLAWQRFSGERGFRPEDLRAAIEEVAGVDLDRWLERALASAEELDYAEMLDWYGLRFTESDAENGKARRKREPAGWLGVDTEVQSGRLVVTQVRRGTPGYEAGVNAGDEIVAIGDYRVPAEGWKERLKAYRPGQQETLLIARRERLLRLPVVFGDEPRPRWKLEAAPEASEEQKARLAAWLRGSADAAAPRTRTPAEASEASEANTALEESHW